MTRRRLVILHVRGRRFRAVRSTGMIWKTVLAMRKAGVCVILLLLVACVQSPTPAVQESAPTVEATVITIRETSLPDGKVIRWRILEHEGLIRMTNEVDRWRVFDMNQRILFWIDSVEGTVESVSFDRLLRDRRQMIERHSSLPAARLERFGDDRLIAGLQARGYRIRLGDYERELWLSGEPVLDRTFFGIRMASDPIVTGGAPVMRGIWSELSDLEGLTLLERTSAIFDGERLVTIRQVESIGEKAVSPDWFAIPNRPDAPSN